MPLLYHSAHSSSSPRIEASGELTLTSWSAPQVARLVGEHCRSPDDLETSLQIISCIQNNLCWSDSVDSWTAPLHTFNWTRAKCWSSRTRRTGSYQEAGNFAWGCILKIILDWLKCCVQVGGWVGGSLMISINPLVGDSDSHQVWKMSGPFVPPGNSVVK